MLDSILKNFAFDLEYLKMLVGDIPEEQMCEQPGGIPNHPAWTVGHLAAACHFGMVLLGRPSSLPDGWAEQFGRGSHPRPDRSAYPSKADLIAQLEQQHASLSDAFRSAEPAVLAAATPDERFRQIMPTVGDAVLFVLLNHTATHLGQLSIWRRAKGLPSVLG